MFGQAGREASVTWREWRSDERDARRERADDDPDWRDSGFIHSTINVSLAWTLGEAKEKEPRKEPGLYDVQRMAVSIFEKSAESVERQPTRCR